MVQFLALLAAHWFADFVCQTNWQAVNKSKDNIALTSHVGSYGVIMSVAALVIFGPSTTLATFLAVNIVLHWATDFCTSRVSAYYRDREQWHNFFVVIGFDQLIHQVTLGLTLEKILR